LLCGPVEGGAFHKGGYAKGAVFIEAGAAISEICAMIYLRAYAHANASPGGDMKLLYVALMMGIVAGGFATPAAAQSNWPTKPVRLVNTVAPGGTADVLARLVADQLSAAFKQQFFVETRAGATGLIGLRSVISTDPDGYNLVLSTQSLLVTLPIINPTIGYNPVRDLTNIAYIGGSPIVFLVNPSGGIKTFSDFVNRGRERPLTYSSSGLGGNGHLMTEFFGQRANVKVEHVPYKGASQGLVDLIGGHIAFSSQTVSSAAGYMRSRTLLALANTADQRLRDYPDLPTLKELGYPDLVASTWFSISAPAKLPPEIAERINQAIVAGLSTPAVQDRLERDGLLTQPMSMPEFHRFIEFEAARWKPVIERAGLVSVKLE
jgi:tripartite-type tricarboxylate transporter receptor subunit TctC